MIKLCNKEQVATHFLLLLAVETGNLPDLTKSENLKS